MISNSNDNFQFVITLLSIRFNFKSLKIVDLISRKMENFILDEMIFPFALLFVTYAKKAAVQRNKNIGRLWASPGL